MIAGIPPGITWGLLLVLAANVWVLVAALIRYLIDDRRSRSFDRWVESQLREDDDAES
jgi:hypothetical protein